MKQETPATLVVERIVRDRVFLLFDLLKETPLHEVSDRYYEACKVSITQKDIIQIYEVWRPVRGHAKWSIHAKLQKVVFWGTIERLIEDQVCKDVADFIYNHWKKENK